MAPRCVKCAGEHLTVQCTKKDEDKPICCNCNGPHPASWRGCKMFPKPIYRNNRNQTNSTNFQRAKPETSEPNTNSKRYNYKRTANRINPQNSIENFPGLPNRPPNAPAWGHNNPNNFPTTDSTFNIPNIDVQNQNQLLTALIGTITKLNARMDEMSATIIQLSQKVLAK
ncbi:hypothetical protein JTE90_026650 [Oedothorax gibbosus]|uniref:Uncharacterized protein n=1 Tax=Oedothorax gibbosus TaxID=931172 RepID=A0AAV6U1F1_9ARAC|nr:hypothetical protein JTE90_026650 [Oedothorax gibbosus]